MKVESKKVPAAVKPLPKANLPSKKKIINRVPVYRPEPAVLVPNSAKSPDQKTYEEKSLKQLDELISRVRTLEERLERSPPKDATELWSRLRTAQGNRSVARTKIKQLRYVRPNNWFTLQTGIDKALNNLEQAVVQLESSLKAEENAKAEPIAPE
ncbi:MAG: hypothetical protein EOP04_01130 [Proteobacteria bacterium]|nr:MAG: hypothetical protein EOP04_01130 [Pseudomonadota bacterium]